MSNPLQEFSINLPMVSVPPMGAAAQPDPAEVPAVEPPPYDITNDVAVPEDVDTTACSHISAYVDSATMASYDPMDPMMCVDLILTVSITNPETGTSSIYKMVKRLAMDKCKLALEAAAHSPVQVVEALEDQEEVKREMSAFYAGMKARQMAGLQESIGDKQAKLAFSFDEGAERKHDTMTFTAVKGKAHARHVFETLHSSKYKNASITRVTMIEGEI